MQVINDIKLKSMTSGRTYQPKKTIWSLIFQSVKIFNTRKTSLKFTANGINKEKVQSYI